MTECTAKEREGCYVDIIVKFLKSTVDGVR